MKVTNSQDGVRRATIRVEYRVGFEDLVRLMCHFATREYPEADERPERLSRDFILDKARESLRSQGSDGPDYWSDNITEDQAEGIEEWARGVVRAAFGVDFGLGVGS